MAFRLEDIFPSGIPIRQLLRNQQGYVAGLTGIPMSPAFEPTLTEMLRTGAPINTRGIESAARGQAGNLWQDILGQINEQMAARGKVGSSAQTAQLARAGERLSSDLGATIAKMRASAEEAAAGRRAGALGEATRAGQLGLRGKMGQAAAGMDLLQLLKTLGVRGSATRPVGQLKTSDLQGLPRPGGGPNISTTSTRKDLGPMAALQGMGLMDLMRGFQARSMPGNTYVGGIPPELAASSPQALLGMNPLFAGPYGVGTGQGLGPLLQQMAISGGAMGDLLKANAALAAPVAEQNARNSFLAQFARYFGPGFVGGAARRY